MPVIEWLRLPQRVQLESGAPDAALALLARSLQPAEQRRWRAAYCESLAQLEQAAAADCELVVLPRNLDWSAFAVLARQSKLPVFAQSDDLAQAREHGAHGVASGGGQDNRAT